MLPKAVVVAFLAIALSSSTTQALPGRVRSPVRLQLPIATLLTDFASRPFSKGGAVAVETRMGVVSPTAVTPRHPAVRALVTHHRDSDPRLTRSRLQKKP